MKPNRLAILGATGSIGRQALEVIAEQGMSVCALGARGNFKLLAEQAKVFRPAIVALAEPQAASQLQPLLPEGTKLLSGENAMTELVRLSRPDILLAGMVGSAGLAPTLAGIECGAAIALANKETLVMAGAIVMPAARQAGVAVLPVDSEHSAIFQCLASGRRQEVRKVTITASGGALRDWTDAQVDSATVEQTLDHPTWDMGPKITIDSATMINKALELIEAHWLFDLPPEQLDVVIHPESVVHSLVEFCDGSVIAQLAMPDMRMPIAYALGHPRRPVRAVKSLDLAELGKLTFRPLSPRYRRAVDLAYHAIRKGGTAGAVLNSANEEAVAAFLEGKISFGRLVPLVETVLHAAAAPAAPPGLRELMEADAWARRQIRQAIGV